MQFFRKGARVSQAQLGAGVVIEANRRYTTIAFDDGAVRKFVTDLVRLEPSARPLAVTAAPPSARQPRRHAPLNAQKTTS
jgi:hypothetical protein